MKFVKYNLTKDGTIPSFILDGGYFPVLNNNKSPQDLDLIGVSSGNNGLKEFKTKSELLEYLQTTYVVTLTDEFWKLKNG